MCIKMALTEHRKLSALFKGGRTVMSKLKTLAVAPLLALAAGCASYYKVTDTSSGREYYTQEVSRQGSAVQFTDAKTGATTTLQNSQVLEIDEDAYKAGLAASTPKVAQAAPAAAPTGATAAPAAPAVAPK
jgi:hypothetical protein